MILHLSAIESLGPYVINRALTEWLGADELARCRRLFGRRRNEYIAGRVILRQLLSEFEDASPQSWCLYERPDLPPLIPTAEARGLYFSISHSGGMLAVVASDTQPVAVDMESFRQRDFLALAEYYFHPGEATSLSELTGLEQRSEFYHLWTLKEACIKLQLGSVLSDLPRRLVFSSHEQRSNDLKKPEPKFALNYLSRDNFALSIAVVSGEPCEEIAVREVDLSSWSPSYSAQSRPVFKQYDGWL